MVTLSELPVTARRVRLMKSSEDIYHVKGIWYMFKQSCILLIYIPSVRITMAEHQMPEG